MFDLNTQSTVTTKKASSSSMGIFEHYLFEHYLIVWVFLCITVGIGMGQLFPEFFRFVGRLEIAQINLPVAVLIWLMIIPMLLRIDLRALSGVRRRWRNPVRELGRQAFLYGPSRLDLHSRIIRRLAEIIGILQPASLLALLATLVLLFGFQGKQILAQPLIILMLAVPILIQVFFNSGLAYLLNRAIRSPHCVAGPSGLVRTPGGCCAL